MKLHRITPWIQKGAILVLFCVILVPIVSLGSWHILLNDHFELPASTWPWGSWRIQYSQPSWGIQSTYWNVGFGTQAIWIMGWPFQNGYDPEYDEYPPNFYRYMYWGPFSLAEAEDARVTFYLLNQTTNYLGDSCWWGAASSNPTSYLSYFQGGHHYGIMNEFQVRMYSLAELDSMGDTISMCGRPEVYIGWFFRANGDQNTDMGAIIDDVLLAWDDGMFDLRAMFAEMMDLDTVSLFQDPVAGDTILFQFQWVCSGNGDTEPFNLTGELNDSLIYTERLSAHGETTYYTYSDPWVVEPGEWLIRWSLDVDDEIEESSETNNVVEGETLYVAEPNVPPMIVLLTPPAGGVTADDSYLITWLDEDPDDNALIYLFYDNDSVGYNGIYIDPGYVIEEDSPIDSLRWNTSSLPSGTSYWIHARIDDPYNSMFTYAAGPVHVVHTAVGPSHHSDIPVEYSLAPVYPNPFNASATINFGVPVSSRVQVQVFNVLGRKVADLADGNYAAGYHRVIWTPNDTPSGVYLVRLQSSDFTHTQKVVLMK